MTLTVIQYIHIKKEINRVENIFITLIITGKYQEFLTCMRLVSTSASGLGNPGQ